jgi:diacylglycerol kinase (ATP)
MNTSYHPKNNPHKTNRGLARAYYAAINSWRGLIFAFKEESAFRQELVLAIFLIPLAIFLPVTSSERLLMIGSIMLVLITELLNSSIEAAIDRISFEINDLSKRAKDMGSAAVLLALLTCLLVWAAILYEEFWGVLVNR